MNTDTAHPAKHQNELIRAWCERHDVEAFEPMPTGLLTERYLRKVGDPAEFEGKTILEIGAGRSSYARLFLEAGCRRYYANDLVPSRLQAIRVPDDRFVPLPGDFLGIDVPERVDFIFANLVMMFVMPMLDDFIAKMHAHLATGGRVITMDSNYLCPLSILRRFVLDIGANPARIFSPFAYARRFRHFGFEVEKLVPFTGPVPWVTGNWVLGTTFFLRARKL
jgi:SAM-dependent methyltransferase